LEEEQRAHSKKGAEAKTKSVADLATLNWNKREALKAAKRSRHEICRTRQCSSVHQDNAVSFRSPWAVVQLHLYHTVWPVVEIISWQMHMKRDNRVLERYV